MELAAKYFIQIFFSFHVKSIKYAWDYELVTKVCSGLVSTIRTSRRTHVSFCAY